ncbi:sulfatase [bacterium]|nr:sulfatase [bacterium]
MKKILVIIFFAVFYSCSQSEIQKQPNVLFIAVDDWNDWVGCLSGHPDVLTPNVDKLAAEGLLFTNAHCSSPICNPSRTSILTGKMPASTGIYSNAQWWIPRVPYVITLPKYFRNNGYYVAGGGKIFHHTAGFNDPDAWDEYYVWNKKARENGLAEQWQRPAGPHPEKTPASVITKRTKRYFDYAPLEVPDSVMPDSKTAQWAANFLQKKHDKPFFLAIGMFRPHIEWYVPKKYFEMYPLDKIHLPEYLGNDLDDVPEIARKFALDSGSDHDFVKDSGIWKELVQAYLASISFSDAQVGKVLEGLESGPNKRNTIIVFWSDHGYHLGEKDHWHKSTLWKRATHIPLIFKVPEVTIAGTTCKRPVSLIDLYPTLAGLCNLPAPLNIDGKSITPLILDPDLKWDSPAVVDYLYGNRSVITEKYHLIRYSSGEKELYNLEKDPNEWVNLAKDTAYQTIIDKLMIEMPDSFAKDAPTKNQFIFDPLNYTFTRKVDNKIFHGFFNKPDFSWIKDSN